MNLLERALLEGPSIDTPYCCVCGRSYPLNRHHVVRRSAGSESPLLTLCGNGSNLYGVGPDGRRVQYCHGSVHHHMLHLKYEEGQWWYARTPEPTKYERVLESGEWHRISDADRF